MKKRIVLAITCLVAVGALAIGAVFSLKQDSIVSSYTPPKEELPGKGAIGNEKTDQDSYSTSIEYTDNGFVPRDITIAQGTRVRFVNHSREVVWPASGVHPTHTLYPEKESNDCLGSAFDACQGISPGSFYDFTFYYVGRWSYHDHLHAYNAGSITVSASETP